MIVFGIDGADWGVIHRLWERDQLPNLHRLAESGFSAPLQTAYGKSPVIWTTIATGRVPQDHGITGFVASGPDGDVPVSSATRRVPALWNMTSVAGLRAAVLGWWATWPAEEIEGVVLSDRALVEDEKRVSPAAFGERFEQIRKEALARTTEFGGNPAARDRDRVVAEAARQLADEGFDLMLIYFRGVDIASHFFWKAWEPEAFPDPDPAWVELHREEIPRVYRATDRAIGEVLGRAPESNVFVVSDHGFHSVREEVRVVVDFDRVLGALGFLERAEGGGVDLERSRAYTLETAPAEVPKRVAFGPGVDVEIEKELTAELEAVRYSSGQPAFEVRDPPAGETARGVGLVVHVRTEGATTTLVADGAELPGAIREIARISGSHGAHTPGIFVARGPDLDPEADPGRLGIHDIAPTILYALGIPVADDMAGDPRVTLFTREYRERSPLERIGSWGESGPGAAVSSEGDEELMEELRTLGYLD